MAMSKHCTKISWSHHRKNVERPRKCRLGTWADNPACGDTSRPMLVLRQGDARLVAQEHSLQLSIKWQDLNGDEQTLHKNLMVAP